MNMSREDLAREQEELALEATRRAANVASTDQREAHACVSHYNQRAAHHADRARELRTPTSG
ncbi:hypothetical protein ACWGDX_29635 [Streptomyces sp. NPDC055025]